jgi:hypothetical protein
MLSTLERARGTDIGRHLAEGFLNSAEYMMYVSGPTGYRFNYSYCSDTQVPKPALCGCLIN